LQRLVLKEPETWRQSRAAFLCYIRLHYWTPSCEQQSPADRAVGQMVNRRRPTAAVRVRSQTMWDSGGFPLPILIPHTAPYSLIITSPILYGLDNDKTSLNNGFVKKS
jgi:hypothetical protein